MEKPDGSWWINEPLILGARNPTDEELADLLRGRFRLIVSLLGKRESTNYDSKLAQSAGWSLCTIPVKKDSVPTTKQIETFIKCVTAAPKGDNVLVHCQTGLGRTAFMGAAYLIAKGMKPGDAIECVTRAAEDKSWRTPQRAKALARWAARRASAKVTKTRYRHNVYVIELDPAVYNSTRFRRSNPEHDITKPCVYVGCTGLTPEERFAKHKAGIRANRYVQRFGLRLLPKLYAYANPMPYDAARDMEVELAIALREQGYAVWQG